MENWRSPLASIPPCSADQLGKHRATQVATGELGGGSSCIHAGDPVWTRLELAKGTRNKFRMRGQPGANRFLIGLAPIGDAGPSAKGGQRTIRKLAASPDRTPPHRRRNAHPATRRASWVRRPARTP